MDHAVSLVQAYLQLNGYFTSAEYPIIAGAGRNGFRTITDIDILAFRFPTGVPLPQGRKTPQGIDLSEVDSGLGVAPNTVDMIIGEVKEGRVGINSGVRDPAVLKAVISRFGNSAEEDETIVGSLLATGVASLSSGYMVRLIAFGAFPPGSQVPPCRIISLGHVLTFLQNYVKTHWEVLRHLRKPFDLQELTDAVTHAVGDAVPVPRDLKAEFCRRSIIAGAKAGAVFTLADAHHLTASMHFGYSTEMIDRFAPLRVDSPYPVCVAYRGAHPVWLSVRSMTDEYPEIFRAARANGSDAIAAVPIRRGGETIGAAGWSFREALSFDEKQRARFEEIAEFLATEIGPPLSLTG